MSIFRDLIYVQQGIDKVAIIVKSTKIGYQVVDLYSRQSSYVECNDILTRSIRSFDNLFFKCNVSLPLVTGELLQKTLDVTYKLYNIKYIKTTYNR